MTETLVPKMSSMPQIRRFPSRFCAGGVNMYWNTLKCEHLMQLVKKGDRLCGEVRFMKSGSLETSELPQRIELEVRQQDASII